MTYISQFQALELYLSENCILVVNIFQTLQNTDIEPTIFITFWPVGHIPVLQMKLLGILATKRKANKFSVKSTNWIAHLYTWDFRIMVCPFQQTKNSSRCSNACEQSYHTRKGTENTVFQGCLSSLHLQRSKEKKFTKTFSCPKKFLLSSCL